MGESDFIRQSDGPSDINLDDENIQNIRSSQIDNSKQLLKNGEILQENTNVLDEENTNVLEPLERKPVFFRKQTSVEKIKEDNPDISECDVLSKDGGMCDGVYKVSISENSSSPNADVPYQVIKYIKSDCQNFLTIGREEAKTHQEIQKKTSGVVKIYPEETKETKNGFYIRMEFMEKSLDDLMDALSEPTKFRKALQTERL